MKCPICNAELKRVPNNSKRLKCESCHHVFDLGQLERLYGIKSGDKIHAATMPYETQHMHEKHNQTGNAETRHTQGNTVNKNTTFTDENIPIQTTISNMIGQNWNRNQSQPQPNAQQQQRKSTMSPAGKTILWVCIIVFFILPFLFTTCTALVGLFAADWDDSNTNTNANTNTNVFYGRTSNTHNSNTYNSNTYISGTSTSDLEATSPEITFDVNKNDYYSEVLIVHLNWENKADYNYDVSAYTVFNVIAKTPQGDALRTAYISDIPGVFDSDSKFDDVVRGQKGTGDWAFTLDGAKEVLVSVVANNDEYDYADPPMIEITLNIKDGKAEIVKTDNPFDKTGDSK